MSDRRTRAVALFREVQDEICDAMESLEPSARFRRDVWTRAEGGGGESRVLEGGDYLEKGGVNFSEVHGTFSESFAANLPAGEGLEFWASGVSVVLHPRNPYAPTVHCNFRMIERGSAAWYGGGADLTPHYLFEEDARHFHSTLRAACDAHDSAFYPDFKHRCDAYFHIPHRQEHRGVGGIFYDYLTPGSTGLDDAALFAFHTEAAHSFVPAYLPIAQRRGDTEYGERERTWQRIRRGRYVEFNLMYDRGTIFGLKTGGRIESILMSLPPDVAWAYDHHPEPGTPEAQTMTVIKEARDWA
jgi:coproporphyrinogen III oxidase